MNDRCLKTGLLLSFLAVTLACGDPLVAPELITGNRVLAARVQVATDANSAWVMPAEAGRVRWLVASPAGPPALSWAFSACVAETTSRGLPLCAAPAFSQFTQTAPSTAEPHFDFTMPAQATLGGATQIAISGAACESGAPAWGATVGELSAATCPDGSGRPLLATVEVQAAINGATNANPDFGRVTLLLDNAEWPAWSEDEATADGCANPTLSVPQVAVGGPSHELAFSIPGDMSERLVQVTERSAARETLSLAHFVTAGDLERAYSEVDLDVDPATTRVRWTAPETVPVGGEFVRFYLVLRDGRGGNDFVERALCVVPQ